MACGGNTETTANANADTDTTAVLTDTVKSIDHSGTYEYINPYNSLDLIENHYIVLEKNNDNTYSGRYYGTTDLFDEAREGYLPGFFVLPMENILIEGENLSFELTPSTQDFFNEAVLLSMNSSADAQTAGFTAWEIGLKPEQKKFTAKLLGGTISLENQVEEMTFIPMN